MSGSQLWEMLIERGYADILLNTLLLLGVHFFTGLGPFQWDHKAPAEHQKNYMVCLPNKTLLQLGYSVMGKDYIL